MIFIPLVILQLWLAHALVFFPHEFAHSFTAWLLGWKANPLALNYGTPSLAVVLAQFGINENVNYQPIFSSGNGWVAGIIAASGMVIGNMLVTFFLSLWLYRMAHRRHLPIFGMLLYWTTVASVGNFWDYVPIRVFATSGDMFTIAKGFACSPWLVLLVLGIPTAIALVYLFQKFQAKALMWFFPDSKVKRGLMIILTAFAIFGFYGAAGWAEDCGPESRWLSKFSVLILAPLMMIYGLWNDRKSVQIKLGVGDHKKSQY